MSRTRDFELEQRLARHHLWFPYTQMKTAIAPWRVVAADGIYLVLEDGRRIIDGISSWWTACHGHRHPHLVAALIDQLSRLPHVMMGGLVHEPGEVLARRLANLLPGDLNHVFFCDSGSVAVEVAMKMAVQYWINCGVSRRHRFLTFSNSYHGDTSGAMALCDPEEGMHAHFKGFLLEQYSQPIPATREEWSNFRRFVADRQQSIAAIVIEPMVQAAGGMKFHLPDQLREIHSVAAEFDLLVIHDEIATGFGRTGKMFAGEWADVTPDIICLGKALTGGVVSLAAAVARTELFAAFYGDDPQRALMHGPTYMGNPLACRAALASLDLFEREPRLSQVARIEAAGSELLKPATRLDGVIDVRTRGAFLVVELDHIIDAAAVMSAAPGLGVWLRPLRNVIYLAPPFIIEEHELEILAKGVCQLIRQGI